MSRQLHRIKALRISGGKIFAFTDPMSNTGYFYPLSLLKMKDETPESYFRRTIFTYSHDRSINAVADGVADGASVDNLILEYARQRDPELSERISVIWESKEFGMPPVVVPKQLEEEKRLKFEKLFLDITLHNPSCFDRHPVPSPESQEEILSFKNILVSRLILQQKLC